MALERLRRCPTEIGDQFWPTGKSKKRGRPKKCEDPPLSEDVSPTAELPAVAEAPIPPHTKRASTRQGKVHGAIAKSSEDG